MASTNGTQDDTRKASTGLKRSNATWGKTQNREVQVRTGRRVATHDSVSSGDSIQSDASDSARGSAQKERRGGSPVRQPGEEVKWVRAADILGDESRPSSPPPTPKNSPPPIPQPKATTRPNAPSPLRVITTFPTPSSTKKEGTDGRRDQTLPSSTEEKRPARRPGASRVDKPSSPGPVSSPVDRVRNAYFSERTEDYANERRPFSPTPPANRPPTPIPRLVPKVPSLMINVSSTPSPRPVHKRDGVGDRKAQLSPSFQQHEQTHTNQRQRNDVQASAAPSSSSPGASGKGVPGSSQEPVRHLRSRFREEDLVPVEGVPSEGKENKLPSPAQHRSAKAPPAREEPIPGLQKISLWERIGADKDRRYLSDSA